jgi:hypothetical protein
VASGNVDQAKQTFEQIRAFKNWQLFLEGQVNTQLGTITYSLGDEAKAIELLEKGYPKSAEGPLVLGAAYYRQNRVEDAKQALRSSGSVWNIRVLHFEFVSDFEIRISNFECRHVSNRKIVQLISARILSGQDRSNC